MPLSSMTEGWLCLHRCGFGGQAVREVKLLGGVTHDGRWRLETLVKQGPIRSGARDSSRERSAGASLWFGEGPKRRATCSRGCVAAFAGG